MGCPDRSEEEAVGALLVVAGDATALGLPVRADMKPEKRLDPAVEEAGALTIVSAAATELASVTAEDVPLPVVPR